MSKQYEVSSLVVELDAIASLQTTAGLAEKSVAAVLLAQLYFLMSETTDDEMVAQHVEDFADSHYEIFLANKRKILEWMCKFIKKKIQLEQLKNKDNK